MQNFAQQILAKFTNIKGRKLTYTAFVLGLQRETNCFCLLR